MIFLSENRFFSLFLKKLNITKMKGFWLAILMIIFFSGLNAQNVDAFVSPDSTSSYVDSADINNSVEDTSAELSFKTVTDFMYNFSVMLFWPDYTDNFVIGSTSRKLNHIIATKFDYRILHGRMVDVVLVSSASMPKANIIYVTKNNYNLLPTIVAHYKNSSTVIVTETAAGLSMGADIAIVKTYSKSLGYYFSFKYNENNLRAKNIILSPSFRGYAAQ